MKSLMLLLFSWCSFAQGQGVLTLDQYLESVRDRNDAYKASRESEEAAKLYQREGRLLISPSLFANARYASDAKPIALPIPNANNFEKLNSESYELGIEQQTTIGLKGKLFYALSETEYVGLAPPYAEGRPALELSQSLWRNDFGREVRAQVKAATEAAKATAHDEAFNRQNLLVQAEVAYWRLGLARENRDLAEENLKRSQRIHSWASRRVKLSLADRSDLLQAQAGLEARQLELQIAESEMRSAAMNFNSARGAPDDVVVEKLEPLSKEVIGNVKIPEKFSARQDLLAAQAKAEAAKASAIVSRERNQPMLEIFGTYAFNSRESTKDDALSEGWNGDLPTKMIGLKFSSPLNFGAMGDVQEGYAKQAKAAELQYNRKRFLQEQEWRDLVLKLNETKARLAAIESLEKAQRVKLDFERQRQDRGRTTLFQVLTFETDYLASQNQRIRTLAELLQLVAQMKLYGVTDESR